MAWQKAHWADPGIHNEELIGGTRVRLTFPDGAVVIGKLTVAPNLRAAGAITMVRLVTPWSGDIWIDAQEADVETWVSDSFTQPD